MTWLVRDRVQVSLPYGTDGKSVHLATIDRIRVTGPAIANPQRTIHVAFDDPLIFGGVGMAWVSPDVLTKPGEEPAEPERTTT